MVSTLRVGIANQTGNSDAQFLASGGYNGTPTLNTTPPTAFTQATGTYVDPSGRWFITAGAPLAPTPQGFSAQTPLVIPGQPLDADSSFTLSGSYNNAGQFGQLLASTAYVTGAGADINAICGTCISSIAFSGGAGMAAVGIAAVPNAVAHGIEIESDSWAANTDTTGALFISGGSNQTGQTIRVISNNAAAAPNYFVRLDSTNGQAPLQPGASVMAATGPSFTVNNLFDFRNTGITGYILTTPRFHVEASGGIRIDTAAWTYHPDEAITTFGRSAALVSNSGSAALRLGSSSSGPVCNLEIRTYMNTVPGSIYNDGVTTYYNTASDYRLKDHVKPMSDALDRVAKLRPVSYQFKAQPGHVYDGFLAHEVSAVVPHAVIGDHNGVDADGDPIHQQMDASKLVPLLVAAILELRGKVQALEMRK